MKLSGLVAVIIALLAPGVLLAADDWRGWSTGDRMALSEADAVNSFVGKPADSADDRRFYSPAAALLASLDWLFDAKAGYADANIAIRGDDAEATVSLADAGLRWKPSSNVGFGLSYAMMPRDDEYSNDSAETDLDLDYVGPRLSLDIAF